MRFTVTFREGIDIDRCQYICFIRPENPIAIGPAIVILNVALFYAQFTDAIAHGTQAYTK